MITRVAVFTLACLALAGCDALPGLDQARPQPLATATPLPPPDPQTQMAPLEIRIAALIEEQRE